MQTFCVLPVVLSAVVGLYSNGVEPTALPKERIAWLLAKVQELNVPLQTVEEQSVSLIAATPSQDSLPPSVAPSDYQYNYDEIQSLKRQLIDLTQKRTERMTAHELKQAVAETRRQFLVAELKALADESPDQFDGLRAGIAAAALIAKDRNDLAATIRSSADELEQGELGINCN